MENFFDENITLTKSWLSSLNYHNHVERQITLQKHIKVFALLYQKKMYKNGRTQFT